MLVLALLSNVVVAVQAALAVKVAYREHLQRVQEACRAGMVKPTTEQAGVEALFPAVALVVLGGSTHSAEDEGPPKDNTASTSERPR